MFFGILVKFLSLKTLANLVICPLWYAAQVGTIIWSGAWVVPGFKFKKPEKIVCFLRAFWIPAFLEELDNFRRQIRNLRKKLL